jgi:hypothetical protein
MARSVTTLFHLAAILPQVEEKENKLQNLWQYCHPMK